MKHRVIAIIASDGLSIVCHDIAWCVCLQTTVLDIVEATTTAKVITQNKAQSLCPSHAQCCDIRR